MSHSADRTRQSRKRSPRKVLRIDERTRAIAPPLHLTSTFERGTDNLYRAGYLCARRQYGLRSTRRPYSPRSNVARMPCCFSSGMAAAPRCSRRSRGRSCRGAQGYVLVAAQLVAGIRGRTWGLEIDTVDMSDIGALRRAIKPGRTENRLGGDTGKIPPLGRRRSCRPPQRSRMRPGRASPSIQPVCHARTHTPHRVGRPIWSCIRPPNTSTAIRTSSRARWDARERRHWARLEQAREQLGGILGSVRGLAADAGNAHIIPRVRTAVATAQCARGSPDRASGARGRALSGTRGFSRPCNRRTPDAGRLLAR